MRGHIVKRGAKYSIVVDVGRNHRNKRIQKWFSGYHKKKDAEKDLPNILKKIEQGYVEKVDMKLSEYFLPWLESRKKTVAPGTYEYYESYMRKHIIPGLGNITTKKLEHNHIEFFMEEVEEKELAQRSKKHFYVILSSALKKGKRYGIKSDTMEDIEAPRVDREEIEHWAQGELHQFLDSLKSKNHAMPIVLALATGMRRGEILGLTWSKINFENRTISVTHQLKKDDVLRILSPQLKTKTSYRVIDIDDNTIEILKKHKRQQEKDKMKVGLDYGELDLINAITIGGFIKPTYLRTVFRRTIEKSGVDNITFHGLRHTHATLLLQAGRTS